jgi:hypothetical protein
MAAQPQAGNTLKRKVVPSAHSRARTAARVFHTRPATVGQDRFWRSPQATSGYHAHRLTAEALYIKAVPLPTHPQQRNTRKVEKRKQIKYTNTREIGGTDYRVRHPVIKQVIHQYTRGREYRSRRTLYYKQVIHQYARNREYRSGVRHTINR